MTPTPTQGDIILALRAAAGSYGLDPEILIKQCEAESSLRCLVPASTKGAIGPMQLLPGTAKDLGVNPYDWKANIAGGAKYDAQLLKQFGSIDKALAAYNWGPGNLKHDLDFQAHLDKHGNEWRAALPKETADYLDKILGPVVPDSSTTADG